MNVDIRNKRETESLEEINLCLEKKNVSSINERETESPEIRIVRLQAQQLALKI